DDDLRRVGARSHWRPSSRWILRGSQTLTVKRRKDSSDGPWECQRGSGLCRPKRASWRSAVLEAAHRIRGGRGGRGAARNGRAGAGRFRLPRSKSEGSKVVAGPPHRGGLPADFGPDALDERVHDPGGQIVDLLGRPGSVFRLDPDVES